MAVSLSRVCRQMPTPRPRPHGRDQGRTLHPLGPRPDARDPRGTATLEKQDARHAAARGLWGLQGHSSALGEAANLGCEGKSLSSRNSWQLIHMFDYDGADKIKYIHRPSRSQRKKITRSSNTDLCKMSPAKAMLLVVGRGMDPCFWEPSAFPEKQPRQPRKGWSPAPEQGWGYATQDGLLWTPSLDYPASNRMPSTPALGLDIQNNRIFLNSQNTLLREVMVSPKAWRRTEMNLPVVMTE